MSAGGAESIGDLVEALYEYVLDCMLIASIIRRSSRSSL